MPQSDQSAAAVPCLICGYDLQTLFADAKCPECGNEVALSTAGDRLVDANPFWLLTLTLAAFLLIFSSTVGLVHDIFLTLVLLRDPSNASPGSDFVVQNLLHFTNYAQIGMQGVYFISLWLLSAPEPIGNTVDGVAVKNFAVRRVMRIAVLVLLALTLLVTVRWLPSIYSIVEMMRCIVFAVVLGLEFTILKDLARRLGDSVLYRGIPLVLVATVVSWLLLKCLPSAASLMHVYIGSSRQAMPILQGLWCAAQVYALVLVFRCHSLLRSTTQAVSQKWLSSTKMA